MKLHFPITTNFSSNLMFPLNLTNYINHMLQCTIPMCLFHIQKGCDKTLVFDNLEWEGLNIYVCLKNPVPVGLYCTSQKFDKPSQMLIRSAFLYRTTQHTQGFSHKPECGAMLPKPIKYEWPLISSYTTTIQYLAHDDLCQEYSSFPRISYREPWRAIRALFSRRGEAAGTVF